MKELSEHFGRQREVVVGRELTKQFEQIKRGTVESVYNFFSLNTDSLRGEFVVMVSGSKHDQVDMDLSQHKLLRELLRVLPASKAASVVSRLTGKSKQIIYQQALELQSEMRRTKHLQMIYKKTGYRSCCHTVVPILFC